MTTSTRSEAKLFKKHMFNVPSYLYFCCMTDRQTNGRTKLFTTWMLIGMRNRVVPFVTSLHKGRFVVFLKRLLIGYFMLV